MKGLDLYHQKKVWFLQIHGVNVEITNKKARFAGMRFERVLINERDYIEAYFVE